MEVTRALKGNGHFAITKSVGAFRKSAECWLRDCSDIKEKNGTTASDKYMR